MNSYTLRRCQMTVMPSLITGQSSVCSTFSSGKHHRNIKRPYYRPFLNGIHRSRMNSSHNGTATKNTFSFDDLIVQSVTLSIQEALWPNKLRCNLNSRPRNRAFGAHHWNTHKSTPNKHAKQKLSETNVKYLRKWLNLRPELWSIWRPKITRKVDLWGQHTYESSSNWRVHEDWCETSGKVLRKWPNNGICTYSGGPKWPNNWASDAHILHTF